MSALCNGCMHERIVFRMCRGVGGALNVVNVHMSALGTGCIDEYTDTY